jgi:dolichol-phosphate mannosyltransferase
MNQNQRMLHLCVVAPFYNEQDNVNIFYETLKTTLSNLGVTHSFVFVDDGSEDKTLLCLNEIADNDPSATVISLARNFGHQVAITAGLDYAESDVVVMMDSDLQHPPETIAEMLSKFEQGADVVYALRKNAEDLGIMKRLTSKIYYWLFQRMANVQIIPEAPDFRLISRRVVHNLRNMRETHRYLRGMIPWLGFPSAIVYYEQTNRYAGQSKYTWQKMLTLAYHGLFSFSTVPLDFIVWLGLIFIFLGTVYLVYILWHVFFVGGLTPGWSSLIITLIVLSGVQLLSMGIVARYIGMVFEETKDRPIYVLKQERVGQCQQKRQREMADEQV